MASLVARGVRKWFGPVLAVDVDLQVERGEIVGVLGPNGAGKTTTLKLVMGLLQPDAGSLSVLGLDVGKHPVAVRRRVGYVPEETSLYDELTVKDNLAFFAALYGVKKRDRSGKVAEMLELFDLGDKATAKAGRLSKGMRRRVVIAQALMHEPEMLILDEPTSGLDVSSTRLLRRIVADVNGRLGTTVLLTTHQIDEAGALCTRIAIMQRGGIVAAGTPAELRASVARRTVLDVTFARAGGAPAGDAELAGVEDSLRALPAIGTVTRTGGAFRLVLEDITGAIGAVAGIATGLGIRVASLSSREPSLEDAFVAITGIDAGTLDGGVQR